MKMQQNAYFSSHKDERQDNVNSLITLEFQISSKIRIGDDIGFCSMRAQANVTKVSISGVSFHPIMPNFCRKEHVRKRERKIGKF